MRERIPFMVRRGRTHLAAKSLAESVEEYAPNGLPNKRSLATAGRISMRERLLVDGCDLGSLLNLVGRCEPKSLLNLTGGYEPKSLLNPAGGHGRDTHIGNAYKMPESGYHTAT